MWGRKSRVTRKSKLKRVRLVHRYVFAFSFDVSRNLRVTFFLPVAEGDTLTNGESPYKCKCLL